MTKYVLLLGGADLDERSGNRERQKTLDAATALARNCPVPELQDGYVEVA
jgi:hypothetical protein